MGTISDKLVYLDGTREQIKENLNKFGSNITENDTFRSYSNVINDIYDKLPKVSGNGSNFTLENAQNGKLDSFGMDGNTEQTTYSGKNLCGIPNQTFTHNGVAVTINDGEITLNGTASSTGTKMLDPINTTILNGSYTLNKIYISGTAVKTDSTNYGNFNIRKQSDGTIIDGTQCGYNAENTNIKKTISESTSIIFGIYVTNNTTYTNYKFKPQLIVGNEEDYNFEPYVGGTPSPNPDYPQDVKVVENEQNINVHGKNILNITLERPVGYSTTTNGITFTINEDKTITVDGTVTGTDNARFTFIDNGTILGTNKKITTQLIDGTINGQCSFFAYDSSYTNSKSSQVTTDGSVYATTLATNVEYAKFRLTVYAGTTVNNAKIGLMVLDSLDDTTYEPYQSQDYEIDLHGKNLFDKNNANILNASIGTTVGTNYGLISDSNNAKTLYIPIKSNTTYTVSKIASQRFVVGIINETPEIGKICNNVMYSSGGTKVTITSGVNDSYLCLYYFLNGIDTLTEQQIRDSIQIEEGSQATDYEDFYDYKLCEIEDYKDAIFKNNQLSEYYDSTLDEDSWYIKKEIGKISYSDNNYSSFSVNTVTSTFVQILTPIIDNIFPSSGGSDEGNDKILSNYISNLGGITATKKIRINLPHSILGTTSSSTNPECKTAFINLMTNKILIFYYVLATPIYETITNETLINQLEAIETETGTNIFEVSNDNDVLPSLNVKRLKELEKLS